MASKKTFNAVKEEDLSTLLDKSVSDFSDSSGNEYTESSESEYGDTVQVSDSSSNLGKDDTQESQDLSSMSTNNTLSEEFRPRFRQDPNNDHYIPGFKPKSVLPEIDNNHKPFSLSDVLHANTDQNSSFSDALHVNTDQNSSLGSINTLFIPTLSSSPVLQKKTFYSRTTPPLAKRKKKNYRTSIRRLTNYLDPRHINKHHLKKDVRKK